MRFCLFFSVTFLILLSLSCSTGPPENPDGKYGKPVSKKDAMELKDLLPRQGQFLRREIVLFGTIVEIDTLSGTWFILKSGTESIKCTIGDEFGLPQSLVGTDAFAGGVLTIVQVSKEPGRKPGAEYTFGADPSGSDYMDELRLEVKGVEVVLENAEG